MNPSKNRNRKRKNKGIFSGYKLRGDYFGRKLIALVSLSVLVMAVGVYALGQGEERDDCANPLCSCPVGSCHCDNCFAVCTESEPDCICTDCLSGADCMCGTDDACPGNECGDCGNCGGECDGNCGDCESSCDEGDNCCGDSGAECSCMPGGCGCIGDLGTCYCEGDGGEIEPMYCYWYHYYGECWCITPDYCEECNWYDRNNCPCAMICSACGPNCTCGSNCNCSPTCINTGGECGAPTVTTPMQTFCVFNEQELLDAITAAGTTPSVICIDESFTIINLVEILAGQDITLMTHDGVTEAVLEVDALPQRHFIINGADGNPGKLTIAPEAAIKLTRSVRLQNQGAGTNTRRGGGVIVNAYGKFIMHSGVIYNNLADTASEANFGGGVTVNANASFIMYGGIIDSNRFVHTTGGGGGVRVRPDGTFIMVNGTISNNSAGNGGGVFAEGDDSFIMLGGQISGNNSSAGGSNGGGVDVIGNFTMHDGKIINNITGSATGTGSEGGGGIRVRDGNFVMLKGEISGNTVRQGDGGGVYVGNGNFTMQEGCTISDNTSLRGDITRGGGGVFVRDGDFNMDGGEVSGNNALLSGGGVYVLNGDFHMTDGEITGNWLPGEATNDRINGGGGGVRVINGDFNMTGGKINNNELRSHRGGSGNGVYLLNGNFTMSNGEISNNEFVYTGTLSVSRGFGGGIYSVNDDGTTRTMTITNSTVSGNSARSGGGVYLNNTKLVLTNSQINNNTANYSGGTGGGIHIDSNSAIEMQNSEVKGNESISRGGGIYLAHVGTNIVSIDESSVFSGNSNSITTIDRTYNLTNESTVYDFYASKIAILDGQWSEAPHDFTGQVLDGNFRYGYNQHDIGFETRTVRYSGNGGSLVPNDGRDISFPTGFPVTVLDKGAMKAYEAVFKGWQSSSPLIIGGIAYPGHVFYLTDNVTLGAKWWNVSRIVFDPNGGVTGSGESERRVLEGKTIDQAFDLPYEHPFVLPDDLPFDRPSKALPSTENGGAPTRTGYNFLGWSTNQNHDPEDLADLLTDDHVVTLSQMLYAVWERAEYFTFEVTTTAPGQTFYIPLDGTSNRGYFSPGGVSKWWTPYDWIIEYTDGAAVHTITRSFTPSNSIPSPYIGETGTNSEGIRIDFTTVGTHTITIRPNGTEDKWFAAFGFGSGTSGAASQSNKNMVTKIISPITPLMTRNKSNLNHAPEQSEWALTFRGCKNLTMGTDFNFCPTSWAGIEYVGDSFAYMMFNEITNDFTMNSVFNLPQDITNVGTLFASGMFQACSGDAFTMNEVFNLPPRITTVGNSFAIIMFGGCFGKSFTMNDVFNLPQEITTVSGSFAEMMFWACFGEAFTMNDVFNLPQKLTAVENRFASRMFLNCYGAAFTMNDEFNLPQGITTIGTDFANSMFAGCNGTGFEINNVFKFPQLSESELNKTACFANTFRSIRSYPEQTRTAESIINGNNIPATQRSTFSGTPGANDVNYTDGTQPNPAFSDWEMVPHNWGGPNGRKVVYVFTGLEGSGFDTSGLRNLPADRIQPLSNVVNPASRITTANGFPMNYSTQTWYTSEELSGVPFDFSTPLPAGELGVITLYALDNVAFDNTSAHRTLSPGTFANILIGKSFDLESTMTVNRTVTYYNLGSEAKTVTVNGDYRHFLINSGGTLNYSANMNTTFTRAAGYDGNGGGVHAAAGSAFNMHGGAVSGNKAATRGGGVYVAENAAFVMHSGSITDNHANSGGGIYAADYSGLDIRGGAYGAVFSGNTAGSGAFDFGVFNWGANIPDFPGGNPKDIKWSLTGNGLSSWGNSIPGTHLLNNFDINYDRSFTVTFDTKGGTLPSGFTNPVVLETITDSDGGSIGHGGRISGVDPNRPAADLANLHANPNTPYYIPVVTRVSHEFIGWSAVEDDESLDYEFTADTSVSRNITVYAQWKRLPMTMSIKKDIDFGTNLIQRNGFVKMGDGDGYSHNNDSIVLTVHNPHESGWAIYVMATAKNPDDENCCCRFLASRMYIGNGSTPIGGSSAPIFVYNPDTHPPSAQIDVLWGDLEGGGLTVRNGADVQAEKYQTILDWNFMFASP